MTQNIAAVVLSAAIRVKVRIGPISRLEASRSRSVGLPLTRGAQVEKGLPIWRAVALSFRWVLVVPVILIAKPSPEHGNRKNAGDDTCNV